MSGPIHSALILGHLALANVGLCSRISKVHKTDLAGLRLLLIELEFKMTGSVVRLSKIVLRNQRQQGCVLPVVAKCTKQTCRNAAFTCELQPSAKLGQCRVHSIFSNVSARQWHVYPQKIVQTFRNVLPNICSGSGVDLVRRKPNRLPTNVLQ